MLLLADRAYRTAIVDLSDGELSTNGTRATRAGERDAATELLGLATRVSLGLPDGAIGCDASHGEAVVGVLRELRPRIVLAPFPSDRHPDHAATGRLVQEASFLAGVAKHAPRARPHRPRRVYSYMLHHVFEPSAVVDVTPVWERRAALVDVYESQWAEAADAAPTAINDPHFRKLLEARATVYGAMVGVAYGEPFHVAGPLRLHELPELAGTTESSRYSAYL
jgi:bacillithiol biosynthesis deacetylase BshB1